MTERPSVIAEIFGNQTKSYIKNISAKIHIERRDQKGSNLLANTN